MSLAGDGGPIPHDGLDEFRDDHLGYPQPIDIDAATLSSPTSREPSPPSRGASDRRSPPSLLNVDDDLAYQYWLRRADPVLQDVHDASLGQQRHDLFLVKFVHVRCGPCPTACNPLQSIDLGDIVHYCHRSIPPPPLRRNFPYRPPPPPPRATKSVLDDPTLLLRRTFEEAADLVLRQEHPPRVLDKSPSPQSLSEGVALGEERERERGRGEEGNTTMAVSLKSRVRSVHVHWAGRGDRGLEIGSNLFKMPDVRTVQQQLEAVYRRGHRDWLVVEFESYESTTVRCRTAPVAADGRPRGSGGGDASSSSSSLWDDGKGRDGSTGGGDALMDSPPPPSAADADVPSSLLHGYDGMHMNEYDDDADGSGPYPGPRYNDTANASPSRPQGGDEEQRGNQDSQNTLKQDSQGLIW